MGSLGGAELIIIGLVVLVLFGAGGLPKAARSLGKAKVEVDKAKTEYEKVITPVADAKRKFDQTVNASPQQLAKRALTSPAPKAIEPSTEPAGEPAEIAPETAIDATEVTAAPESIDQPLPFADPASTANEAESSNES